MDESVKAIAIAIVAAGIIIAGSIFYVNRDGGGASQVASPTGAGQPTIRAVEEDEHILGNADAPIVIVEYSDLECPFCKEFHVTLKRVLEEYGDSVAWVYRHFPLEQIHPNAPLIAEASECIAELGGNQAFWDFVDGVFESAPGNSRLDLALLPDLASSVGVSAEALTECLESDRHVEKVNEDFNEAITSGGQGTPYSIIIANGQFIPVSGSQPFEAFKAFIDNTLAAE